MIQTNFVQNDQHRTSSTTTRDLKEASASAIRVRIPNLLVMGACRPAAARRARGGGGL